MDVKRNVDLSFACEMDKRMRFEIELKGWIQSVQAHLPDGRSVEICFWDPVRLAQDLKTDLGLGKNV